MWWSMALWLASEPPMGGCAHSSEAACHGWWRESELTIVSGFSTYYKRDQLQRLCQKIRRWRWSSLFYLRICPHYFLLLVFIVADAWRLAFVAAFPWRSLKPKSSGKSCQRLGQHHWQCLGKSSCYSGGKAFPAICGSQYCLTWSLKNTVPNHSSIKYLSVYVLLLTRISHPPKQTNKTNSINS